MTFDWVVVGAGFTGATFAERMATSGRRVLVVEERSHIGGNAYDEHNEFGILIHRYGPHIFHTNSPAVWAYLSRFTEWRSYEHRVLGELEKRMVPIPFNLNSLDALFERKEAIKLTDLLLAQYGHDQKVPILKLLQSAHPDLKRLAEYIYKNVFEQYTIKQWALRPEELSPSVTARVPVLIGRDNRYFQDKYQAMPRDGYRRLFGNMLSHSNITLALNSKWKSIAPRIRADQIFYTGAIDELLDFEFEPLPYRSLRFDEQTFHKEKIQPVGTVNYPNTNEYTRITEQKHLTGQNGSHSTIIVEYPQMHTPGRNIPYYPIPRDENHKHYKQYYAAAKTRFPNFVFAGRLADYQYYNMDQACARALKLAQDYGATAAANET